MLYCPKCQQKYEEGTQRFCVHDETRLLPTLSAGNSFNQTGGVFANVLSRVSAQNNQADDKFSSVPAFRPPVTSRIFKEDVSGAPENKLPTETQPPVRKPVEQSLQKPTLETAPLPKPVPRMVQPPVLADSRAQLGDRKANPTGRLALSWENTAVLVGQTIKGRYLITEKIGQNESSVRYLAQDKIGEGRKVSVRVLMNEDGDNDSTKKVFAEEMVSLSHISHPSVASVFDSGELPEGIPFVVSENVEGKSVKDMLGQSGQFNAQRAARIIRQASYALSEAHQSGILHRSLEPENIILPVSENGVETVKLTNFGFSTGKLHKESFGYKSPEEVAAKMPTVASDVFSLAVIAFQMLTNRLPFNAAAPGDLYKSQRNGLKTLPSELRPDLNSTVDNILEKALAFNPTERYSKVRDFGDAFFNAITTTALWEDKAESRDEIKTNEKAEALLVEPEKITGTEPAKAKAKPTFLDTKERQTDAEQSILPQVELPTTKTPVAAPLISVRANENEADGVKATTDLAWEKRSLEPPVKAGKNWAITALLGAIVVFSALGLGYYAFNRANEVEFAQMPQPAAQPAGSKEENITLQKASPVTDQIESPPPSRSLPPPPDAVFFENSKQSLKSETAKNFLGFSLYYPNDWRRNDAKNNFLDVSKNAATGTPIEQLLVSHYDSKGTFKADKELFPALVKETNNTLKTIVPNYKAVSEGEKTVNNGWRAYEVNFQGNGKTAKGEDIKLWGRRLFIPAARNGMKNGYVLTMLATSLSPDVKSIEDVGVKGSLHTILYSFEPNQNF